MNPKPTPAAQRIADQMPDPHTTARNLHAEAASDDLFGPVIASYSRAQAIEDGVLVDVSTTAREANIKFPVALTRAVYEDMVAWSDEDAQRKGGCPQDESGRLWDVLWMLYVAIRNARGSTARLDYGVLRIPREGRGRKARLVRLKSICGPGDSAEPVITIMQPDED